MMNEAPESGGNIRPRPARIVMIALLAAVALTLAYPMSARKSTRPSGQAVGEAATVAPDQPNPQLSFSMRTVVRPMPDARMSDHQAPTHVPESLPKFEGYLTQPARP